MIETEKTHWNLDDAVVGSHVLVPGGRYGGVSSIRRVTAVNARKVTLNDGTEWTRRGRKWGTTTDRWMSSPHARLIIDLAAVQAEVAEEQREADLAEARRQIGNRFDNQAGRLTIEEIAAVNAILDASQKAREPKPEGLDEVGEQVRSERSE